MGSLLRQRDVSGVFSPPVGEYDAHPDYRQIASFFLGWVFWYSVQCIMHSSLAEDIIRRFRLRKPFLWLAPNVSADPEKVTAFDPLSLDSSSRSFRLKGDSPTIRFSLYLSFLISSIANFGSVVDFSTTSGDTGCAFLVAWGGLAIELSKVVALLIIGLEIRQLGAGARLMISFWAILAIVTVLAFVTTALATGSIVVVESLNIAICDRKRFLPTSIISSLLEFFAALFALAKLILLISPPTFDISSPIKSVRDIRVVQAISIIVFVLMTMVPSAVPTSILGDFIPLSLGSLLVLAAFSYRAAPLDVQVEVRMPDQLTRHTSRAGSDVFGVYVPKSASLRMSMAARSSENFVDYPYATPSHHTSSLHRQMTGASVDGSARFGPSHRNSVQGPEDIPDRPPARQGMHRPYIRHLTPDVTPTAANVVSSVASVVETPWRKSDGWKGGPILPSHVAYADALAQSDAARVNPVPPPRLRLTIPDTSTPASTVPAVLGNARPMSLSPNSAAVYGSDIVRPSAGMFDRMRSVRETRSPLDDEGQSAGGSLAPATSRASRFSRRTEMSYADEDGTWRFGAPPRITRRPTDASVHSIVSAYTHSSHRSDGRSHRPTIEEIFVPPLPMPSTLPLFSSRGSPQTTERATSRLIWSPKGPRPPSAAYLLPSKEERPRLSVLVPVREEMPTLELSDKESVQT